MADTFTLALTGLVVGLDGSGDQTTQTPFTVQSIINMLGNLGITLPPGQSLQLKNVAAVMASAQRLGVTKLGIVAEVLDALEVRLRMPWDPSNTTLADRKSVV